MSDHLFFTGPGHLSATVDRAVSKIGVDLVNYTEPSPGPGQPGEKRHWFSGPNRGYPFDRELEQETLEILKKVATKGDRKLLKFC